MRTLQLLTLALLVMAAKPVFADWVDVSGYSMSGYFEGPDPLYFDANCGGSSCSFSQDIRLPYDYIDPDTGTPAVYIETVNLAGEVATSASYGHVSASVTGLINGGGGGGQAFEGLIIGRAGAGFTDQLSVT